MAAITSGAVNDTSNIQALLPMTVVSLRPTVEGPCCGLLRTAGLPQPRDLWCMQAGRSKRKMGRASTSSYACDYVNLVAS
eukprot:scaffold75397_cov32-Tisochrysis_lutea.AAC.2